MDKLLPKKSKSSPPVEGDSDDLMTSNEILNMSSGLSQTPIAVVAHSSASNRSRPDNVDSKLANSRGSEGNPMYSTTLIATISVGCTLLLLNILVFLAVYYRDKSNKRKHYHGCHRRKRSHENCDSSCSISNSSVRDTPDICSKICKPPVENGGLKVNFASSKFFLCYLKLYI